MVLWSGKSMIFIQSLDNKVYDICPNHQQNYVYFIDGCQFHHVMLDLTSLIVA